MQTLELGEICLIGIALKTKTSNKDNQSSKDCGALWQKFESERCSTLIPDKMSEQVFAVYHNYEGDHTSPFSYFIGCQVTQDAEVPVGMDRLVIPAASYQKFTAKGKMPDCIANTWKKIWASDLRRAYEMDFEVYDERSSNWNSAEVDIFVSKD